jgi:hypothetical protein
VSVRRAPAAFTLAILQAGACAPQPEAEDRPDEQGPSVVRPDPARFVAGPAMNTPRVNHTATLLDDGRVLVVGGETGFDDAANPRAPLAAAELYDPAAGTFTALPPLAEPRSNHRAVKLRDGRVLIVGGGQSTFSSQPAGVSALASALLFDPTDDTFAATGSLATARGHFGAALLDNGHVIVVGGGAGTHERGGGSCVNIPSCTSLADALASSELYDPATGAWRAGPSLTHPRFSFTLVKSGDDVYAIGGVSETQIGLRSVEVLGPDLAAFRAGPDLPGPARQQHGAVALPSGVVVVVGGKEPNVSPLKRVDAFDPVAGAWQALGELTAARTAPSLTLLPSGAALAIGGFEQIGDGVVATVERITTSLERFAPLTTERLGASATLLADGTVLVCGGTPQSGAALATCERGVP